MAQGYVSPSENGLRVDTLCEIFSNNGYKVIPFKVQNLSLNSLVTKNGEEIARAQTLHAFAANVEPVASILPIIKCE